MAATRRASGVAAVTPGDSIPYKADGMGDPCICINPEIQSFLCCRITVAPPDSHKITDEIRARHLGEHLFSISKKFTKLCFWFA